MEVTSVVEVLYLSDTPNASSDADSFSGSKVLIDEHPTQSYLQPTKEYTRRDS